MAANAESGASGWLANEIRAEFGIGPRTLSLYAEQGLIRRPKLHGRHTRYPMQDVARIGAIQALKRDGYGMREMRHALAQLTSEEIRALAFPNAAAPAATAAQATVGATALPGDTWNRVTLLPGLEINVAASASEFVRRVAAEIAQKYAARAS